MKITKRFKIKLICMCLFIIYILILSYLIRNNMYNEYNVPIIGLLYMITLQIYINQEKLKNYDN